MWCLFLFVFERETLMLFGVIEVLQADGIHYL